MRGGKLHETNAIYVLCVPRVRRPWKAMEETLVSSIGRENVTKQRQTTLRENVLRECERFLLQHGGNKQHENMKYCEVDLLVKSRASRC